MSYQNYNCPCSNCGNQGDDVELTEVTVSDTGAKFDIFLCASCQTNDYGEVNTDENEAFYTI
ncbi:MAG: transposase [Podoviridae sp. ctg2L5]|nr:MAG: transposase [Podoviridae sp. ctg2L5]